MDDFTKDLQALTGLVAGRAATEDVLDRALDALAAVVPHDLSAVYALDGDTLRVVASAGRLNRPAVRGHHLDLRRFPTIRRALELRQPVAPTEDHHASDEGDPYDGVLDLPHGHSCMVVPLFSGRRELGIITLDGQACGMYSPEQVRLAGVYGQLVSLAMVLAEQAALLDRQQRQLKEHNRLLTAETGGADVACARIEASHAPRMQQIARQARQVARSELPVLIRGETGTGKEVLAAAIHAWSPRVEGPFVKLNCSALPEQLVESELFGHVRGAFSGADKERRGRFLTANGGTLLLDEIGDMPLSAQAKLLRVLQEGTFEAVGSDRTTRVDVRVIAATHVDLEAAVAAGRFRQDLYYRLAVFPLHLPALRERPEDIAALAERALQERGGRWHLSEGAVRALEAAPWPGNVRELVNVLERATILAPGAEIGPEHLGLGAVARAAPVETGTLPTFEENERRYWGAVLRASGGRLYGPEGAGAIAGLKPTTLRSRLVKLGLR